MTAPSERVKNDNFTLRAEKTLAVDAGGHAISGVVSKYEDNDTYTYVGHATPGTDVSTTGWSIKRITNADGEVLWASSTFEYTKIWDDRTTYQYG